MNLEDPLFFKKNNDSGSESGSDEDWSLPRPTEGARVKLLGSKKKGKKREKSETGLVLFVDDVKKTFSVAFDNRQKPTQQVFRWK